MLPEPLFGESPVHTSLSTVETVCVNRYPESATRPAIWDGFEEAHTKVVDARAPGEVWVSGEFVVNKEDPDFAQVHLHVPAGAPINETTRELFEWLNDKTNTERLSCDLSTFVGVPDDDPQAFLIQEIEQAFLDIFSTHGETGVKGFPILDLYPSP